MMKNQLAGLMKQAQTMQDNMKKAQEEIAAMEVEGAAGAGLVKVVMTGRHDVKRVSIDATLLTEDKDVLEDLVAAAVNDAVRKVEAASQEQDGRHDRGTATAAGVQAAVLMPQLGTLSSLDELTQALALPARCRARRRHSAWRCTCCSTIATAHSASVVRSRAPRGRIRHCERCNTFTEDELCALCRSGKRDAGAVVRGRDAGRPAHDRAHAGVRADCISC